MRHISFLVLLILFANCTSDPKNNLEHINGYWEIEKVNLNDGSERVYNYNDTIDFISINDSLIGFRKKVKPNFKGTFESSKDIENIKVVIKNDSLHLHYSTAFSNWKETVLIANENELVIINSSKAIYHYKRYQPLDLD